MGSLLMTSFPPFSAPCLLTLFSHSILLGGIVWWSQLYCLSRSSAPVMLLANLVKKASVSVATTKQSSLARTSYHEWSSRVQVAPSASFESHLSNRTGSADETLSSQTLNSHIVLVCRP